VIAARRSREDLAFGTYRSLPSAEGTWAYARGAGTVVLLNFSDAAAGFEGLAPGSVVLSSDDALEGSAVEDSLTLGPWVGAIVAQPEPASS
jgi:hypothetical protein